MHISVLLKEALDFLSVKRGGRYIDATLGLGGHSLEIIRYGGEVLGIEVDEESLAEAKKRIAAEEPRRETPGVSEDLTPGVKEAGVEEAGEESNSKFVRGNFKDIKKIASENGFVPCDGILFDLGMSSWQLEKSGRGFSFQKDEPLDMRMDKSLAVTAADLLNGLNRNELAKLFQKYGEEQSARRIASSVVRARTLKPFRTTADLVGVVERVKSRRGKLHPATKIFQALRIAVNGEISNLRSALPQAFEILAPRLRSGQAGGRLAVISFHSLEDGEVKRFFGRLEREGIGASITRKPVAPAVEEIKTNPRARSAKLRVIEKIAS